MAALADRDLTAEEREFRDDAALAALTGLLAYRGYERAVATASAADAYRIADAMLAARASGSKEA